MQHNLFSHKYILVFIAGASFLAVAAALVSQHLLGMWPCAWCILQRLLFIVIGLLAVIGLMLPNIIAKRAALAITAITSMAGIAAAWHQKTVAAQSFSCDQTLADRIIVGSGLEASVPWLFGIYANCMDAAVRLLGLDFAVWSLLLFLVLAVASIIGLVKSET